MNEFEVTEYFIVNYKREFFILVSSRSKFWSIFKNKDKMNELSKVCLIETKNEFYSDSQIKERYMKTMKNKIAFKLQ